MRLHVVFILLALAGLATISYSSAGDLATRDEIGSGLYVSPQARARCGLTVALTVTIDDGQAFVSANGSAGASCAWIGLDVFFSMRDAETGQWIDFPGYSGSERSWNSDGYNTGGYDKFLATATAHDRTGGACPCCLGDFHTVSASVHN